MTGIQTRSTEEILKWNFVLQNCVLQARASLFWAFLSVYNWPNGNSITIAYAKALFKSQLISSTVFLGMCYTYNFK